MINYSQILNPYGPAFKKVLLQLLGEQKYVKHIDIIEKISENLVNANNYEKMAQFFVDLWEEGFLTCVDQNQENYKKLGIKVKVVPKN
jgi:hypothetical protein